jgi:O-antigen/teichoic acid export membrane protein
MVYGMMGASLIGSFFFLVYFFQRKYISIQFSKQKFIDIAKFCLPMLPHSLSGVVIALSDRLFIKNLLGADAVGKYAVACTFSMIVFVFIQSFVNFWGPWIYKQLSNLDELKRELIVRYIYRFYTFIIPFSLLVWYVCDMILFDIMADKNYSESKSVIIWLCLAFGIQGMYYLLIPIVVESGKTVVLGTFTIFSAFINLFGNYFLIKKLGINGAAISTLLSYSVLFISLYIYEVNTFKFPWFSIYRNKSTLEKSHMIG